MKSTISLIICAKNEEQNILALLQSIKPMKDDEVIIVLDRCTDRTKSIVENFNHDFSLTLIVLTENEWPDAPKKFALLNGIQAAKNELLLFTDADCILPDNHFEINRSLFLHHDVVIGISIPEKLPQNLAESFHLIDFIWTAGLYAFFTRMRLPYMAVGRNWGFKKSLFADSFLKNQNHILSGDDDLLFQQILQKKPRIAINDLTNTNTRFLDSFQKIIKQKSRHLETGMAYSNQAKIQLGIVSAIEILGWLGTIYFLISADLKSAVFCLVFPVMIYILSYQSLSRFFIRFSGKRISPVTFIFFKPLHTFFLLIMSLFSLRKNKSWK